MDKWELPSSLDLGSLVSFPSPFEVEEMGANLEGEGLEEIIQIGRTDPRYLSLTQPHLLNFHPLPR